MSSSNGAVQFPQSMNNSSSSLHPDKTAAVLELDFAGSEGLHSPINKNTRLIFYLRIFIFFIIEASFITLAAACLAKPIVLNTFLSFSESEIKGGFTIVFVIWQSCATLAGGYILADAFSRKWSVQLTRLRPGKTDRVSTVTSGFLDRTIHLFQRGASGTFKLAFFASLVFMALTQLAPGTISVITTIVIPVQVQIGTLAEEANVQNFAEQFLSAVNRASLIIHIEQIENSPLGLILQPNWLMGIPAVDIATLRGVLEYDLDVVSFHHNCHWEAPRVVNTSDLGLLLVAGGQTRSATLVVGVKGGAAGSSIAPLSLTTSQDIENTGISAFFFIGGNDTFGNNQVTPPTPFAIDLGNLPSGLIPGGIGVEVVGLAIVGPLASVLVCDPHLNISGGRVRLTLDGTLSIIDSGRPVIGNFPPSAANPIFSNAFQDALNELDAFETQNHVNTVASVMFMANPTVDWNTAANNPPVDIATINKKIDTFMLSAGKAFINAYRKVGTLPFNFTTTAPATVKEPRLALTTSKNLFQAIIAVFVLALALLCALSRSVLTKKRYQFDLHGVLSVLRWQEGNGFTKTVGCQSSLSLDRPLLSNTQSYNECHCTGCSRYLPV